MNIARFSVTHPVAVTMRIAALILLGAVCAGKLPLDLLPNISLPTVAITTSWPNVSPEEMETEITRPIEEAVSSAPNMYAVTSSSLEGVSTVRIQFQWGSDIGQAAVDTLQLVEKATQKFPTGDPTLEPPVVYKYDPSQLPIQIYGVSGINDPIQLYSLLNNEITPIIESANGVASAVVTGGEQRAILVNVDPLKMRARGVSLAQISNRIAQENVNLPAGIAKENNTEYTIRTLGWFTKPKQIADIPIGMVDGATVSIGQVAKVSDSHQEDRLFTRLNGLPAVGVIILKQSNANTVDTAKNVEAKIAQIKKVYPQLTFHMAYDQSAFIVDSVNDLKVSALIGGSMAVLILLLFLRSVRSTLVIALSIPTSIISTFALMYACGFTLNTMSLGGLALATGLIVDDAVVVLENIFRHIERDGKRPAEAAVSGASEIMSAVVASTLTVIVVFIPLFLIKGQSGQMFAQFAIVVICSLLVSLLDATTVVPMLASRLIKPEDIHSDADALDQPAPLDGAVSGNGFHAIVTAKSTPVRRGLLEPVFNASGRFFNNLDRSYRNGLEWAIKHRMIVVGIAVAVSLAALLLVPQIGSEMMPTTDSGDFQVSVKLPPGTALAVTNAVMLQVEGIVAKDPNVETSFTATGTNLSLNGTSASLNPNVGALMVKLKDGRKLSTVDDMAYLRKQTNRITGARVLYNQTDIVSQILTGGNSNIEIDIFGEDLNKLYSIAMAAEAKMKSVPGFEGVDVNWQDSLPELQWNVNREKALEFGVTFTDIANAINTSTNGYQAGYYQENGYEYPIYVQLPEIYRKTENELMQIPITPSMPGTDAVDHNAGTAGGAVNSSTAGDVLLMQVATPVYAMGPSQITRLNRQRYIAITGQPIQRSTSDIEAEVGAIMSQVKLPQGYYWAWGLTQQRRNEEFAGLGVAIFLAIGLIYILLASQFESFVHPLTILASVPLAAVGVILSLFLTGRHFGLTAFIGVLMLIGIVVKNGILLVDYTNLLRSRGLDRTTALLRAGPTRLRPILMTACAACLGMLPQAIGLGKGSETNAPMATAVIGGLMTSTFLTLFIVPIVYTLFDDIARRYRKDDRDLAPPILEPSLSSIDGRVEPPDAVMD
ncbi:MAG: efflux RND transporter permease subunit [Capsulimonadaceae bacterium]